MDDLYKTLEDLCENFPEEEMIFEMPEGDIFKVIFMEECLSLISDEMSLIYRIIKVIKRVSYDYQTISIEIKKDYLPKNIKFVKRNILQ